MSGRPRDLAADRIRSRFAHQPAERLQGPDRGSAAAPAVPGRLRKASTSERLALVTSLFNQILVGNRRIVSLTPRADVGPV